MLSTEQREYNRLRKREQRSKDKEIEKLYQDANVSGITFTEFKKQYNQLSTWKKISIHLSDRELKIDRLSFKLSDDQLRLIFSKVKELT